MTMRVRVLRCVEIWMMMRSFTLVLLALLSLTSARFNFNNAVQQNDISTFSALPGAKQSHALARSDLVGAVDPSSYKDLWGTWDGTVSYVDVVGGMCATTPTTCGTIVAIAGTSLNITLACPTNYVVYTATITGYTNNQITIKSGAGSYCLTWNGQDNDATMVMDFRLTGATCPAASKAPVCSASHLSYIYTVTKLDYSDFQGTWKGIEVGYVKNGTCQQQKCNATWTVQQSYITITEVCDDGTSSTVPMIINGIASGQLQSYMEFAGPNNTVRIIRYCWVYSQDPKTGWKASLVTDVLNPTTCPKVPADTTCSSPKSLIVVADLECQSGCKYKAPKEGGGGMGLGVKVAIGFVVILVVAGAGVGAVFYFMRRRKAAASNRRYIQHAEERADTF